MGIGERCWNGRTVRGKESGVEYGGMMRGQESGVGIESQSGNGRVGWKREIGV